MLTSGAAVIGDQPLGGGTLARPSQSVVYVGVCEPLFVCV